MAGMGREDRIAVTVVKKICFSLLLCVLFADTYLLYAQVLRTYGAEGNPTGDPIGGGAEYSRIISPAKADYIVSTNSPDELRNKLKRAQPGKIVYVKDSLSINLTSAFNKPIVIPAGVTLASGRGAKGSRGALLYADKDPAIEQHLFEIGGRDVRITGLRFRGPNETTKGPIRAIGVYNPGFSNSEIDNNEFFGWDKTAIDLRKSIGHKVHHNNIHNNTVIGSGYGIKVVDAGVIAIANIFKANRHSVSGAGRPGEHYELAYNVFLNPHEGYPIDMHGSPNNSFSATGGKWMRVHHNSIYTETNLPGGRYHGEFRVEGKIKKYGWVFDNWFKQVEAKATKQVYYKKKRPFVTERGIKQLANNAFAYASKTGWGMNLNWEAEPYKSGDFNGDGKVDLLHIRKDGGQEKLDVLMANDDLGMANSQSGDSWERWGKNESTIGTKRYKIGDFNGDGKSDVIAFKPNASFNVWLSLGNRFMDMGKWGSNGADIGSDRYRIGDFNGDGRTDLASFESNGNFYVWLAKESGGFQAVKKWGSKGIDLGIERYRIGDVNGDYKADIVSIEKGNKFHVWLSQGSGFSYQGQWGSNGYDYEPSVYKLGYVNGDDKIDLISYERQGGLYAWLSTGSGFKKPYRWLSWK